SRETVSRHIVTKLGLERELRLLMAEYGASEPWEVLGTMRRAIYDDMVSDPRVVRDNQWPHTVRLLRLAKEHKCLTALATLSARKEALHFVSALGLEASLDLILAREDVKQGKPNPEIYLLAAQKLGVATQECIVIEDSSNGVRAAIDAGMNVVPFATPFTSKSIHASQVLQHDWVVDDPEKLLDIVQKRIAESNRAAP
ncbi:MAG: HAD family hydrolase, partial [Candidatus Bathyarchaeia archaeon]